MDFKLPNDRNYILYFFLMLIAPSTVYSHLKQETSMRQVVTNFNTAIIEDRTTNEE